MQLKALHLPALALAGAVLLAAALTAPHAVAQAAGDPGISSEREAGQLRIQRAILDLVRHVGKAREREARILHSIYRSKVAPDVLDSQIAWIEEIEQGDPRVMYETALRLRDGDGLPQHQRAARTWFERAGDHGVPEGYYALARMMLDDPEYVGDLLLGLRPLERAAYMGVAAAQKDLGMREIAAASRNKVSLRGYYWLLLARANGAEVDDNALAKASAPLSEEEREDARTSVQKAVGNARLPRSWPLVDDFSTREIWREEVRSALRWHECGSALTALDRARLAGDAEAEHELAVLFEEGTCVDQDAAKALGHFASAFDGGDLRSALRIGLLYYDDRGTAKDIEAARRWFKAAALNLVSYAPTYSAKERLKQLEHDLPRTDAYNRREPPLELVVEFEWVAAIEGGDPQTLFETALRVRDGRGLPRVRRAAEVWLGLAGESGVPEAYYELGLTRLDAPIDPFDESRGIISLASAGRDGFVPAQVELGRRYAAGDQVQQWDHAAYVWLLRAAANGAEVSALLEEVGRRLSDEDRQTARQDAERGTSYPLDSR